MHKHVKIIWSITNNYYSVNYISSETCSDKVIVSLVPDQINNSKY